MRCPLCGFPVTKKPSGAIVHNSTGREACPVPWDQDHIDHSDMMSSIRGVTDH